MKKFLLSNPAKRTIVTIVLLLLMCLPAIPANAAVPSPPQMSYSFDGMDLSIEWTSVPDATGYTLHYAPAPYQGPQTIGSFDMGPATNFDVTLWEGASFFIAASAYNGDGRSSYSNIEQFTINTAVSLNVPTMTLSAQGTFLSVSWTSVEGAAGYNLCYAPHPFQGVESFTCIDMKEQTTFSNMLWPGAAYHVAIQAYDSQGSSDYSNIDYFIMGPPTPEWVDNDGDGYSEVDGDCNDTEISINPGATEVCGDGIDQDCSGADAICVDPNDVDNDGDGYTENQGDCNDKIRAINPGATEICGDGIDQDCNGSDPACPVTCNGVTIEPISLSVGTPLNQTIAAYGTKYYVFDVSVAGDYTIALYNMTTDNDWKLGEYISNCEDDYSSEPIAASVNLNTTDDIGTVQLSPKKYLLVVDEWSNLASSYTLSVTR